MHIQELRAMLNGCPEDCQVQIKVLNGATRPYEIDDVKFGVVDRSNRMKEHNYYRKMIAADKERVAEIKGRLIDLTLDGLTDEAAAEIFKVEKELKQIYQRITKNELDDDSLQEKIRKGRGVVQITLR